jgi:hypothetical protein
VDAHDLYVSPITYLPYHEAPAFTDEMDPLLHKRHGFADHDRAAPVSGWFTEGFDTVDLKDAKALLDQLNA